MINLKMSNITKKLAMTEKECLNKLNKCLKNGNNN